MNDDFVLNTLHFTQSTLLITSITLAHCSVFPFVVFCRAYVFTKLCSLLPCRNTCAVCCHVLYFDGPMCSLNCVLSFRVLTTCAVCCLVLYFVGPMCSLNCVLSFRVGTHVLCVALVIQRAPCTDLAREALIQLAAAPHDPSMIHGGSAMATITSRTPAGAHVRYWGLL